MTCQHCCDANKEFDQKTARKQMKTYRKKGPTGTTKKIIAEMEKIEVQGKQLLDIGGGIGALQWYFLERGGKSTISVDASYSYIAESKKYAGEKEWLDRVKFIEGDFNDQLQEVDSVNIVTLDKVICCYPDYVSILTNSMSKSKEYLALSYPVSNWISRSLNAMVAIFQKLRKSQFRSYVHPVKKVRALIKGENYALIGSSSTFPWIIEVYQRGKL